MVHTPPTPPIDIADDLDIDIDLGNLFGPEMERVSIIAKAREEIMKEIDISNDPGLLQLVEELIIDKPTEPQRGFHETKKAVASYEKNPIRRILESEKIFEWRRQYKIKTGNEPTAVPFLREWKVARVRVEGESIASLRKRVESSSYPGYLMDTPLQDQTSADAFFLFTDENQMHKALHDLVGIYGEKIEYGFQKEGDLFASCQGIQSYWGKGMEQASVLEKPELLAWRVSNAETMGPARNLQQNLLATPGIEKIYEREPVIGVGCSVKVVFDKEKPGCDEAFQKVYSSLARYDATKITPLYGKEITLVSKNSWAAVGEELKKLSESALGEFFWATVHEDEFTTEETDNGAGPRTVKSKNMGVMNAFRPDRTMPYGLYVQNRAYQLAKSRDRAGVSMKTSQAELPEDDEEVFLHMKEFEPLIDRLHVRGSTKLIGREKELIQAKEALEHLKTGGTVNMVLKGPAGGGKTRMAKEIIEIAMREYGVKRIYVLKAPKPEYIGQQEGFAHDPEAGKKPFLLTRALVKNLIGDYGPIDFPEGKAPKHIKDLQDLNRFLQGEQRDEMVIRRFAKDPVQCATVIHEALRGLGGRSGFLLDDGHWWHSDTDAAIIKELKKMEKGEEGEGDLFLDLSRTDEADFVSNLRQGIEWFESAQGAKTSRAKVARIDIGRLPILDKKGNPNQNFLEYILYSLPKNAQKQLKKEFKEKPFILKTLGRLICGPEPEQNALPFDIGEVLNHLQDTGVIGPDGRINMVLYEKLEKGTEDSPGIANMTMHQLRQQRIEDLENTYPYLMELCELMVLFGQEITPSLLKAISGSVKMNEDLMVLQRKNIVTAEEDGKVRFSHDRMGEEMDRHFKEKLPKKAWELYKKLDALCRSNPDVKTTIGRNHPAIFATLLQKALEDGSIPPQEKEERKILAAKHGIPAVRLLCYQNNFGQAAALGDWVAELKSEEQKIVDTHISSTERMRLYLVVMEAALKNGNFGMMTKYAASADEHLGPIEGKDKEWFQKWQTRAHILATEAHGAYETNRNENIEGVIKKYKEHVELLAQKMGKNDLGHIMCEPEHVPHVLQLGISEGRYQIARGYNIPGYESTAEVTSNAEFMEGVGCLTRAVNNAMEIMDKNANNMDPEIRKKIEMKLGETKQTLAQITTLKEVKHRRRIDQKVAYASGEVESNDLIAAVEAYKELFEKNDAEGGVFENPDKEGNAHLYYAEAIMFMKGTGPFKDEAEKIAAFMDHLEKATTVGKEFAAGAAFRQREVADMLAGLAMRNPESFSAAQVSAIIRKYDQAIETLRRIPDTSREVRSDLDEVMPEERFPINYRFTTTAANKAELILYAAEELGLREFRTKEKIQEAFRHIVAAIYVKGGGNLQNVKEEEMPEYAQDYMATLGHCVSLASELGIDLSEDRVSEEVVSWAKTKAMQGYAFMSKKCDYFKGREAIVQKILEGRLRGIEGLLPQN